MGARLGFCLALVALADIGRAPVQPFTRRIESALASRLGKFLGDTSYSVYLIHMLLLIPIAAIMMAISQSAAVRSFLTIGLELPILYLLAWLVHIRIEQPGIAAGKRAIARFYA
jgi:peptidoglycan/LPS O-acetylase OafA/YrhL